MTERESWLTLVLTRVEQDYSDWATRPLTISALQVGDIDLLSEK
jgi:hypothetical protein